MDKTKLFIVGKKEMAKDEYKKSAEKILSLDSNWKNKSEQFKKLSIQIMVNTLKYIENNNFKKEIK